MTTSVETHSSFVAVLGALYLLPAYEIGALVCKSAVSLCLVQLEICETTFVDTTTVVLERVLIPRCKKRKPCAGTCGCPKTEMST